MSVCRGVGGSQFDWFGAPLGLQLARRRDFAGSAHGEKAAESPPHSKAGLAIFPVGLALFYQSAEAFLRVFKFVELVEKNIHRFFEAFSKREAHAAEDRFFGHGKDRARVRGDAVDKLIHRCFELGFGNQASDQSQFQCTFGGNGFAGQNNFKSALWSDQERKDGGGERRKYADGDFGLREASFRCSDDEIAESGEFGASANGWAVYDAEDGLADLEHSGKGSLESFQHLVDTLRGVLADVNAAAKDFAGRVYDYELDFIVLAGEYDAVGDFAEHGLIEEVVIGT